MNIWMLNHYAVPPDTAGITRHYDLGSEMVKRGHRVCIFAAGFNHRTRKEERLEGGQGSRAETINGVEFLWLKTFPYQENDWRRVVNMLSYTVRVVPLGIRHRGRPDAILASSPHPFAGLAGYILARLKRTRFFFEIRDLWPQTFVDLGQYSENSLSVRLLKILEKFLCRKAERVVVVPPKASDYLARLGVPEGRVVGIPNGVSLELFSREGSEIPGELGLFVARTKGEGAMLVAFTGAHGVANAIDTIIDAAEVLQHNKAANVHILLVGDGPEKARLVQRARTLGLENVAFFGPVPKSVMPGLLAKVDIAVLTLGKALVFRYGASPNKLWDYMMSAKPVVWTIDTAHDTVAAANCGLTIPPEDPQALAAAIVDICNLTERERLEMGQRGRDYVLKHNSIPVLAERLLAVLEGAQAASGGGTTTGVLGRWSRSLSHDSA